MDFRSQFHSWVGLAVVAGMLAPGVSRAQEEESPTREERSSETSPEEEEAASDEPELVPPSVLRAEAPKIPETLEAPVDVELQITIDTSGEVVSIEVEDDTLDPALIEEARRVALASRFAPATRGDEAIAVRIRFTVRFEPLATAPSVPEAPPARKRPRPMDDGDDVAPIEVVVTAARGEELASHSAVRVEVISRQELEEGGIRNAAEALEEAHGVQVNRTFRGMELWIRGLDPEYSLILVDGAIMPGRVGGAIDLSRFSVEEIERIEIVRGPSSALYGSDAIGGVVNIITREPKHDFRVSGMGSYGSRNTADATGRIEGRLGKRTFLGLNGGFHHEDPFRLSPGALVTSGSRRVQGTVGGQLDVRVNERHRLNARASYLYLRLEGVEEGAGGAIFDRTQLQEQFQGSVEHRYTKQNRIQLTQRATYTQFREQTLLDQRDDTQLDNLEDHREHMAQYTGIVRLPFSPDHDLTFGAEPTFQMLESPRLPERGERLRLGVFAQYDGRVWKPSWGELRLVPALRADIDSQFGSQVSPKLTARFDVTDSWIFRASYGRGFRAPSFQQLLLRFENPSVGYVVMGNPDLDAERSHGVDVGFLWAPHERVSFGGTFFRNDLQNMIAVVSAPPSPIFGQVFTYDNLETAWTMGAEADTNVRLSKGFRGKLGYAFTQTWDGQNERRLEGRPRHRITTSLRGEIPKIDVIATGRAAVMVGRTYYPVDLATDETSTVHAGAIVQVDLRVEKRFGEWLSLFVGVENLFDAGDQYLLLRPRTFFAGLGTQLTRGGDDAQ